MKKAKCGANVNAKSRKELRKEKRERKKVNRFNYHNVKKNQKNIGKLEKILAEHSYEQESDEEILSSSEEEIKSPPMKITKLQNQDQMQSFLKKQKQEEKDYYKQLRKNRIEQLKQANEEEDKIIHKYEKLLKLNKRKKKDGSTTSKFNDGLEYLLELCTDENIQNMYKAAKEANDESNESQEDCDTISDDALKKNKEHGSDKKQQKLKKIEEKYFGDDEDFFENFKDVDSCDGSDSEVENSGDESDTNVSDEKSDALINSDKDSVISEHESAESESEVFEDIYGRKKDKQGNLIKEDTSKYVPPHLREPIDSIDSESDPKRLEKLKNLKRQINGYINRLAETNLHRISIDIENLYNANARNDVNTVLTNVILNSLVSNILARERLVLEHALLIAVLHANLGSEIGAFFLQIIIEKCNKLCENIDTLKVEDKELDNMVLIISHLYTYRLFKHTIIYELLNKFCEKLSEKRIECILLILKSIGFILRKDDPLMLKEFILRAQKLSSAANEEENTRVKYMMDTLMAIKNNNMTKIPQYDAALVEHFRKLLKQFIRAGKYITTLAVSMDDLLNADERGKWWLIGSAWTGTASNTKDTKKVTGNAVEDEQREKIMELAKKQRMNTDAKRNIFYILMTAEDYIDAFEKILSLTNDHRTIIAVILHCCMSEKDYNAYYSVLSQKFCEHNRKFLLAIQFAVWDKIKDLESFSAKQLSNLSKFLVHLIENDSIPLSVLKVVEFAQIEKITLRFLRQVMLGLLLTKEESFNKIFERIAPSAKLNSFKDQLRLFLKVFLLKDESKCNISEDKLLLLKSRLHLAEKFLSTKSY